MKLLIVFNFIIALILVIIGMYENNVNMGIFAMQFGILGWVLISIERKEKKS